MDHRLMTMIILITVYGMGTRVAARMLVITRWCHLLLAITAEVGERQHNNGE